MATRLLIPLQQETGFSESHEAARAYDAAGEDYLRYADGDATHPFASDSQYSFADREIWARLDAALIAFTLRAVVPCASSTPAVAPEPG